MKSIQEDSAYKSCIKAFDDSIGKILNIYTRPGVNVDVFARFHDSLAELYPVAENLARELNGFYNAGIKIPEDDFESNVEINAALRELHAQTAAFLASDAAFAEVETISLETPHLFERCKTYQKRFAENYDKNEREKGIYWLNNFIEVSYGVVLAEHVRTEESVTNRLDEGEVINKMAESFFRRRKRQINEKEREKAENSIYSAMIDACCGAIAEEGNVSINDINKTFKYILLEKYDMLWDDENDSLRANGREVLDIVNDGRQRFSAWSNIEKKLEEVQSSLKSLDSASVRQIIEKQIEQRDNTVILKFDLNDLRQILRDYPEFEALQREENKKYEQYDKLAEKYKFYEEAEIDDEQLLEYFDIQLKQWIMFTRQDAENLLDGLHDLENEEEFPICGFDDIADFRNSVLETAEDITLIGNVSPSVILTAEVDEDGDPIVVFLNQSGIGTRYVQKLAYEPEKMSQSDYKNLTLLLADFLESCEQYQDYIAYNKNELKQLSVMSDEEYINRLSLLPESVNKRNMIKYSRRAFAEQFRVQTQNLYNAEQDLTDEARGMHAGATKRFERWLEIGLDVYPHFTKDSIAENSLYYNNLLTSLSLPAVYKNKKPNEKEIETTIDYSLSQNGYSEEENKLLKFALMHYQKDIVAEHENLIAEGKINNKLKYKAGHYVKMAEIWSATDSSCEQINELSRQQEKIYHNYLRFKEYEKKILPKDDVLGQLFFLNRKTKGR